MLSPGSTSYHRSMRRASRQPSSFKFPSIVIGPFARVMAYASPRALVCATAGTAPSGQPTAEPLSLSILDVINRALEHNLGILLSDNARGRAEGARWRAMGGLLPTINGRLSETRQVVDLAAYGFPLPEGIPPIVGPFNLFDVRVMASQPIIDL